MRWIDDLLNRITMYRFVLYYLMVLVAVAACLAAFGMLPFRPQDVIFSSLILVFVGWVVNGAFSWAFDAPANVESVYITALILALIITPVGPSQYFTPAGIIFLVWAIVLAIASKFILAIGKKHIFNPAAFAVVVTSFALGQPASWWIGTASMLPFVLVGGLLVARKISRLDLAGSFFVAAFAVIISLGLARGVAPTAIVWRTIIDVPILFFGFIMLTEPLTTPPTRTLRIAYGALVGLIFAPQVHIGPIYSTPELALLVGNVFSYLVSPKGKYILKLREKVRISPDAYDFIFAGDPRLKFIPGQYLEWTLAHRKPDDRGNRRYFTIASSPMEGEVRLGVKFYPNSSSFKKSLVLMSPGADIVASQLAGDFTLPKDKKKKLVLVAGGIGITPFRSMIRDLLDRHEERDITLLYANRTAPEIVYQDVFEEAREKLGIRTVYTLTDMKQIPEAWKGERGYFDAKAIGREVPDYRERMFYLSGPRSLVSGFQETLKGMGVPKRQIKKDFFPGFA